MGANSLAPIIMASSVFAAFVLLMVGVAVYKRRRLRHEMRRRHEEGIYNDIGSYDSFESVGRWEHRRRGMQSHTHALGFSAHNPAQNPALQAPPPAYNPTQACGDAGAGLGAGGGGMGTSTC